MMDPGFVFLLALFPLVLVGIYFQQRRLRAANEQIADNSAVLDSFGISTESDDRYDEWIVGLIASVPIVDPLAMKPCILRVDETHVLLGRDAGASFEQMPLDQLQKGAGFPGDPTADLYCRPEGPGTRLYVVHFDQSRLRDFAHVPWSPSFAPPIRWWHDRRIANS